MLSSHHTASLLPARVKDLENHLVGSLSPSSLLHLSRPRPDTHSHGDGLCVREAMIPFKEFVHSITLASEDNQNTQGAPKAQTGLTFYFWLNHVMPANSEHLSIATHPGTVSPRSAGQTDKPLCIRLPGGRGSQRNSSAQFYHLRITKNPETITPSWLSVEPETHSLKRTEIPRVFALYSVSFAVFSVVS